MKRRVLLPLLGIALLGIALGRISLGADTNCLGKEYLQSAAISFVEQAGDSASGRQRATEVARVNAKKGTVGAVRYGAISDGLPGDGPVHLGYLVVINHDGQPHPLVGTPVGTEALMVTTPCSVVAIDGAGNYLWTHATSFPVK